MSLNCGLPLQEVVGVPRVSNSLSGYKHEQFLEVIDWAVGIEHCLPE